MYSLGVIIALNKMHGNSSPHCETMNAKDLRLLGESDPIVKVAQDKVLHDLNVLTETLSRYWWTIEDSIERDGPLL